MRALKVGVVDVLGRSASRALYARAMRANLAGIMPQVVAVWCEELGHDVSMAYYNGPECMAGALPEQSDVVFISAFTHSALVAYALSNQLRSQGIITALGGPHARSYPEDAQQYFDYVLGFTDKDVVRDVLQDASEHRPVGVRIGAEQQPRSLPGAQARWKFIQLILQKAPFVKIVPMIGSLGCPYTCDFCVDSVVPYQPLEFETLKGDLRFLLERFPRPRVGWHDPNFGVRFNDYLDAIEDAVPPGRIDFVAESTLSLLSEANVRRLARNGFKAMLPGIESWYDHGNKSKTGKSVGPAKVDRVAQHVNMILEHLPYLQANFVLGLDSDAGQEPFELTKRFLDAAPGAFPAYSMLTAFGSSAPLNASYHRAGRVIPFPFHALNNNAAMNVRPKNYSWPEFYDRMIDLARHSFSSRAIRRRLGANRGPWTRSMNVLRAVSSEGWGKIRYLKEVRRRLDQDRPFRQFFDQETDTIPEFFVEQTRRDLGPLWPWLPEGALSHETAEVSAPKKWVARIRHSTSGV